MRHALSSAVLLLLIATSLSAQVRINDVGLHGYWGTPAGVELTVRNPSSQAQSIRVRVGVADNLSEISAVTTDIQLNGDEVRKMELPVLLNAGELKVSVDIAAAGSVFAKDVYRGELRQTSLIALMCDNESDCTAIQSQIEFSGTPQQRSDKNRQVKFETINQARDAWWAYSGARSIVVAMPMTKFTQAQRDALEGYLRCGGRLVLLEHEIADPAFLFAYRTGSVSKSGRRVGKGELFRVSEIAANGLGDVFSNANLNGILSPAYLSWYPNDTSLTQRFATRFTFPRLRWMVLWMAAYIVVIGVVNFGVLRRLHKLEFGWISTCVLALLFAAGFYFSSASHRPKQFRMDNLASYYLDGQSSLAAGDYTVRISAPRRRDLLVSVADPAVFIYPVFNETETNGEIWADMNREAARANHRYDIDLGPPRQVQMHLLKWSFQDLNLRGLRNFPGTVHWVAPNRLRNDTGQQFSEAVFADITADKAYTLPALAPEQEVQLETMPSQPILARNGGALQIAVGTSGQTLLEIARAEAFKFGAPGPVFVGLSDGPALPMDLNVPHREEVHSLIVVALDRP